MLFAALFLTAANVVLWILFFIAYRKNFSADAVLEKIKREVNDLLMDIRKETDMSATILAERIKSLKQLIGEADARTMLAHTSEKKRESEQEIIDALTQKRAANAPAAEASAAGKAKTIYAAKTALDAYKQSVPAGELFNVVTGESPASDNKTEEGSLFNWQNDSLFEIPEIQSVAANSAAADAPIANLTYAPPRISIAQEQIKPKKTTKSAVLELAAEGFTADIIAEKLSISISEARMIIDLFGN